MLCQQLLTPRHRSPGPVQPSIRPSRATLVLSPALIQTVIANGIDYGRGDVVAVYSDIVGYRIIDALRDAGLAISRRR